jgi:hypothetical protein
LPANNAVSRQTKTYLGVSQASAQLVSISPVPTNPRRLGLMIQNTGLNPGFCRFGAPVTGNGSDLLFAPGAVIKWDQSDTVPLESINLASIAGTTWCLMETIPVGTA